jgi:hypothetical protein
MTSIGGLDVAYGARMQVVRTNVMCLALADTGLANATTVPKFILNTYKEGLKGTVIEPDFLYIYEVADMSGSGYTTAAVANGLFNQDNSGDGTADTTALEVNGVLRDIRQVPLAVNSAFQINPLQQHTLLKVLHTHCTRMMTYMVTWLSNLF